MGIVDPGRHGCAVPSQVSKVLPSTLEPSIHQRQVRGQVLESEIVSD